MLVLPWSPVDGRKLWMAYCFASTMGHTDVYLPQSLYESSCWKVHEVFFILGHLWGKWWCWCEPSLFRYKAAIDLATITCSFHDLGEVYNIETVASSGCWGHYCWTIKSLVSTMILLCGLLSPFASMLQTWENMISLYSQECSIWTMCANENYW